MSSVQLLVLAVALGANAVFMFRMADKLYLENPMCLLCIVISVCSGIGAVISLVASILPH